jgi:tetratricopeptide (TPR) repeat protein
MLPARAVGPDRAPSGRDNVNSISRSGVATAPGAFPWRQAAIVAAVALAVRVLFWLPAGRSLFMQTPVVDASFFDLWARALTEGRVFQAQVFFKPPLAAYVLAALYRLGLDMPGVLVVQLGVGVVTSVLTFAIGRLVFTPRVALAGALAAAALPILPFFEAQMVAEAWTTALAQGSLLLLLLALRDRERRPVAKLAWSGLALGLAALGRPNVLIVLPVLAVWLWRQERAGRRPGWRALVPLAIGCAVALVPSTLHNLRYGAFVPVSANLGVNLLTGHNDQADGVSAIPVGVRWDGLQLEMRQRGAVTAGAVSALTTRDALRWAAAHPGRELQLLGKKALLLLNAGEGRNNINPRWLAEEEGVFVLARWWPGTWLLLPLAVGGLVFWPREPRADLLRWLIIVQAAAILPFFVAARFRAPLLPLGALFAAAFVAQLLAWRRVDRRRFLLALFVAAALFGVVNVDWFGLGHDRWLAADHYNLAVIHTRAFGGRQPDAALAERHFRRAIELDPDDVDARERFGSFLLTRARPDVERAASLLAAGRVAEGAAARSRAAPLLAEGARHHGRALELYPRSFRSALNLGLCRLWQGELTVLDLNPAPTAADATVASAALAYYGLADDALQTAARIDPSWGDPRQALQDVRRRALAVPNVTPAVEVAKGRFQPGGAGARP